MPWQPLSDVVADWGRLRLLFNGVDVTIWDDVVTEIGEWSKSEPFGDKTASFRFPGVSPLAPLPVWLTDWADVELWLIRPDGSGKVLWEGMAASEEDDIQGEPGLTVPCIGALYQADLFIKEPTINDGARDVNAPTEMGTRDIGRLIADSLASKPSRIAPLQAPAGSIQTGIVSSERGSFNGMLTGYIQDLLATAYNNPTLADAEQGVDIELNPAGSGYWLVGSLGSLVPFGQVDYHGSMLGVRLNEDATGLAVHPSGTGYWYCGSDGGVFAFNVPFYGSLGSTGNPNDIVEIVVAPDGGGYYMADTIGGVFCFGSANFLGSLPGIPVVPVEPIVDMTVTPSNLGYRLLGADGGVFCFGDAAHYGDATAEPRTFVAMADSPSGQGYVLLADTGECYAYGDADYHGNTPSPLNAPARDIAMTEDGGGYIIVARDGGVFALGNAQYLGNGFDGMGDIHQWTLLKNPGKIPILKIKDRKTVQWTISCAAPGVSHSLSRDFSMAPNVGYGEGIDLEHCAWRNTEYPIQTLQNASFSGTSFGHGANNDDSRRWLQEMRAHGWGVDPEGTFDDRAVTACQKLQEAAGLPVTGFVDVNTWNATFGVGDDYADLRSAYVAPLAILSAVDPYLYNANGSIRGSNPGYDPTSVRVERYENFGDGIGKLQAQRWMEAELMKDHVPAYVGTITLVTDPAEGSRFEIEPGHNLYFDHHRGVRKRFHVSDVSVNWHDLTVTLTVDERARDSMTVASIIARDKASVDPSRRRTYRNKKSKQVDDQRAIFDCESGAGYIPDTSTSANAWVIKQIAVGEYGSVVRTLLKTAAATKLAAGIFDRQIQVSDLTSHGSSPFTTGVGGLAFWDTFDETTGLIEAWGGADAAGGYWPKNQSDPGATLTGVTQDNAAWDFVSTNPPWLWLAVWTEATTTVSGRLYPAPPER